MEFLDNQLEKCKQVSESLCKLETIGKSYEGRDLKVFNVSRK